MKTTCPRCGVETRRVSMFMPGACLEHDAEAAMAIRETMHLSPLNPVHARLFHLTEAVIGEWVKKTRP